MVITLDLFKKIFSHVLIFIYLLFLFILFWLRRIFVVACGLLSCGTWDLVPQSGIEPRPPALGVWSLTHWTTREVSTLALRRAPYSQTPTSWFSH